MNTHTVRDCRYISVIVSPIAANSIVFVVSYIQKGFVSLKATVPLIINLSLLHMYAVCIIRMFVTLNLSFLAHDMEVDYCCYSNFSV